MWSEGVIVRPVNWKIDAMNAIGVYDDDGHMLFERVNEHGDINEEDKRLMREVCAAINQGWWLRTAGRCNPA